VSRRYPQRPLIGVGGLIFQGDSVLLVRRGREPAKGRWSIPGGLVETGERLSEAVAREILEETGLTVETGPLVEVFERLERDEKGRVVYHYVILDYLCLKADGLPKAASDAAEVCWADPEKEASLGLWPETLAVIAKARRLNRSLSGREPGEIRTRP
jgi:ADP-ribose pyrophosphatase YjhB (NUDIX family)